MIYPPVCGFCGKLDKNSLCNKCKIRIEKNALYKIEDYRKTTSFFDEHLYLFQYIGEIREAILNFKFNEQSYLWKTFIYFLKNETNDELLSQMIDDKKAKSKFKNKVRYNSNFLENKKNNKKICIQIKKYDIIMPIPISKKRMKQRGYNQSAVIASNLAKTFNMDCKNNILVKIKDNPPQSELGQNERSKNVKDVYKLKNEKNIFQKKILLIDDIYTTGSTANECARLLKENFASEVGIFTIAKD